MKTVVITGGGGGMGQAIGLRFFDQGYYVVLVDLVAPETLGGKPLSEYEERVIGLDCDVSIGARVTELFEKIKTKISPREITSCVNGAGIIGELHPLDEVPEELWDKVLSVNLKGVFLCMKEGIRSGAKSIVNISSVAGTSPLPNLSPYSCTKAGIISLTKAAAKEYGPRGVRVNCVAPGAIQTPMFQGIADKVGPEFRPAMEASSALGRLGTPEEVAEAVFFLTEGPGFVHGESLVIGGGYNL